MGRQSGWCSLGATNVCAVRLRHGGPRPDPEPAEFLAAALYLSGTSPFRQGEPNSSARGSEQANGMHAAPSSDIVTCGETVHDFLVFYGRLLRF